ncbi:DUF3973 domain-containing protein [Heyndrickxia sp. NPDC080065]|uniref:DUF3973 domain-containing protein n=1 Tax=Heyndrickxia sp. NPDC080065 TaxID=3390568 RepID=UPI003CFECDAF
MYYCVACSRLHKEKVGKSKIFENGFYIDPLLGQKIHLGMCDKEDCVGSKQNRIRQSVIQREFPKIVSIMDYLPAHHRKESNNIIS